MFKILKWIFFVIILAVALVWIFVSLDILNIYTVDWEPLNQLRNWVNGFAKTNINTIGLKLLLSGGSVFFIYNAAAFIIKKIPIIGRIFKWLTGIINFIAVAAIAIGAVLLFAI